MSSNPFVNVDKKKMPVGTITDYHKDEDLYIIDYAEVKHVKIIGEKDTDFIENVVVEEIGRTNRQDYYDEQSGDVGILNILRKVAFSGDESLLNQTHRLSNPGSEKDALGRPVEDIVDLTDYSGVDRVQALNKFKEGAAVYQDLDPALKGNKSFEEVAKMSDDEIHQYIKDSVDSYLAQVAAVRSGEEKGE